MMLGPFFQSFLKRNWRRFEASVELKTFVELAFEFFFNFIMFACLHHLFTESSLYKCQPSHNLARFRLIYSETQSDSNVFIVTDLLDTLQFDMQTYVTWFCAIIVKIRKY